MHARDGIKDFIVDQEKKKLFVVNFHNHEYPHISELKMISYSLTYNPTLVI